MLTAAAHRAARLAASATTRALSSSSSLPSSSTPAPPPRTTRTDGSKPKPKSKLRDHDYRLRTRVLRSAAYATHELASSSTSPPRPDNAPRPRSKDYVAQAGFRATPYRRAAEFTRIGTGKTGRGALVGVDPEQVEASMARKGTRHSGAPLVRRQGRSVPHQGAGPAAPTRRHGAAPGPSSWSRSLHTSAAAARGSARLAEESLAGFDADVDLSGSADGGLWDDADFGAEGGAGNKGKARARELEMGDFVEISRSVSLSLFLDPLLVSERAADSCLSVRPLAATATRPRASTSRARPPRRGASSSSRRRASGPSTRSTT